MSVVPSQDNLIPLGIFLEPSGDIFGSHNLGVGSAIGIWAVETRDAAKYPTMYKTAPNPNKSDPQMLLVLRLKAQI